MTIKKLDSSTPDLTRQNIERLLELFPECRTEGSRDDAPMVDFDLLRQALSDYLVEGPAERYRLEWPGKRQALLTANTPINKTLRPMREESVDFNTTRNLFIEGDNLEALKLLQETYLGKVKMIYIDPPYNTGGDFIYNDDFAETQIEHERSSELRDNFGSRLIANPDSSGRFHSNWLSFLYPRLKLARNLLRQDGVIMISIDDVELPQMQKMCEAIFSESNEIAKIVRNTNSSKNQSSFVSVGHDYCLIYAKDIDYLKSSLGDRKWEVPKNNVEEYEKRVRILRQEGLSQEEITEELKSLTRYPRFIDFTNYWYFDERGLYRKGDLGGVKNGNMKPLYNPLTKADDPVPPGGYRYSEDKLAQLVDDRRIHFHIGGSLPTIKRYLHENRGQRPKSIMSDDQRPDYALLREFETPFDNPKQLAFLERILSVGGNEGIFIDFFAGSASTAHALLNLNAQDTGNRKYILVQLDEPIPADHEAAQFGLENVAQLSRERIRKASAKVLVENPELKGKIDRGFRAFRIDSGNFTDTRVTPKEATQEALAGMVSHIKEDRSEEDLLFGALLRWGVDITLPVEQRELAGRNVWLVDPPSDGAEGAALIACFARPQNGKGGIDTELADAMAELGPLRVLFRDDGFADDATKENVHSRFQQRAPDTQVRVL